MDATCPIKDRSAALQIHSTVATLYDIKRLAFVSAFVVLITAHFAPAYAQGKSRTIQSENTTLPADFSLDYQLGLTERSKLSGSAAFVEGSELSETGYAVFSGFVKDQSIASLNLPYQWKFSILNDGSINAYSLPDGEVSVGSGLAKLMGRDPGLWAATLSHETAHVVRRHAVRKYLFDLSMAQQIAYEEALVRAGNNSANWVLLGLRISAPIARAKLSRDLEHDADIEGMMLMAREGYHPDFVFALHHLLMTQVGEQSKFAAFFSTHPRWETRDQRDDNAYAAAFEEFNRLWPDPSTSPGGTPPVVAFAGGGKAQENKEAQTADLSLPIYCRNATEPLQLLILFEKDHQLLRSESIEYSDDKGNLAFHEEFECSEKSEAIPIVIHLPASLVTKDQRKVKALASVYDGNHSLVETFKPFDVHFPKP